MPSLRLGIWTTVFYVAIIASATFYLFHIQDRPSDTFDALAALLPVQFVAVFFCLLVVVRSTGWRAAGFGRLSLSGLVWFAPAWLVLIGMGWGIAEALTLDGLRAFGAIGAALLLSTTFLIAFGEEVVFRGLLLRGAMTRFAAPAAMLLSAACFGLFHLVNWLAGQDVGQTSQQIFFAVLVGFFLAPIALRIGNLWPLIIWHWFWNIAVILGQTAGILHPLALAGIAVQAVISIWLWAEIGRTLRTA